MYIEDLVQSTTIYYLISEKVKMCKREQLHSVNLSSNETVKLKQVQNISKCKNKTPLVQKITEK